MSTAPRHIPHYTVDDYQHWEGDWELIDGVPIAMSPSPFGIHERIVTRLAFQIRAGIQSSGCDCEVYTNLDWIVSHDTVIRPDVMVICGEQPDRHLERPPSLIAEVLSPSTENSDRNAKRSIAHQYGVPNYLIISPDDRTVTQAAGNSPVVLSGEKETLIRLNNACVVSVTVSELFDAPET